MAFSSVPIYLDPPNWQQQGNEHQQLGVTNENPLQLSSAVRGTTRPGSLTDRARLAKITTQPEMALKCPRCESTNTKFCYFNNYNLSQPRHFCKTCRRYWTRGGALRNVPVGGGCRRNNKRSSKRGRSKSPVKGNVASTSNDIISNLSTPPPLTTTTHLSFLSSTAPNFMSDFTSTQNGLNFGGNDQMEVQGGSMSLSARFADQFRFQQMQQFPFFAALEQPSNVYQFEHQASEYENKTLELGNVKVEENKNNGISQGGMNLARNNFGVTQNHHQILSNMWTDHISGYTSTSTSQLL